MTAGPRYSSDPVLPGPRPPSLIVADTLLTSDGRTVPSPASVLLQGHAAREGAAVRAGPVAVPDAGAPDGARTAVFPGTHHGRPAEVGLGVAAPSGGADAVFAAWERVAGMPHTVLLAAPRSFCAGVERAIEVVERLLEERGAPVYVRKQIVHNTSVVADLERRGAVFVDELDAVPAGAPAVFSAHGVSPAVRDRADRGGLDVVDATCPLVTKVHAEARRFADRGDTVVLIGHAGHEEVEGTLGEAPEATVLVERPEDVAGLEVRDPARVSYLTQTTLAVDEAGAVVDALRARFPALRGPASDDICYATTNRQDALAAVAARSDAVLVVGSPNSSNSVRLVELAERSGTPAHLIDGPADIRPEWLEGASTVGLTAGASAPPALVEAVVAAIGGLGPVTVQEHETARETVRFTLPSALRRR